MAAVALLSEQRMKKSNRRKHPLKESEIPVDLKTMREFHAQFMAGMNHVLYRMDSLESRMAALEHRMEALEHRMEALEHRMEAFEHRMDAFELKMQAFEARMEERFHKVILLLEEQNLRNKQAYDGYLIAYEKAHSLEARLKPECFKD